MLRKILSRAYIACRRICLQNLQPVAGNSTDVSVHKVLKQASFGSIPAGVSSDKGAENASQIQTGGEKLQSLIVILAVSHPLTASLLPQNLGKEFFLELWE